MSMTPGSMMGVRLGKRHARNRHHLSKLKGEANFTATLEQVDYISEGLVAELATALKEGRNHRELDTSILERALDGMFLYLYNKRPETSYKKQEVIAAVEMFVGEISRKSAIVDVVDIVGPHQGVHNRHGVFAQNGARAAGKEDSPLEPYMKVNGMLKFEALDELTVMLAASFESTAHTICQCLIALSKDNGRQKHGGGQG